MVTKYCDHCPLYRQRRIYAREGVDLDRSTMAGWVGRCRDCSIRWWRRWAATCCAADKVHADDTPVKVLAPGARQDQDRAAVGLRAR